MTGPDGSNVTTGASDVRPGESPQRERATPRRGPRRVHGRLAQRLGRRRRPQRRTFVFTEVRPPTAQDTAPTTPASPPHRLPAAAAAATGPAPTAPRPPRPRPRPQARAARGSVHRQRAEDARYQRCAGRHVLQTRRRFATCSKGKIDNSGLNYSLAIGEGLESALADSCTVDPRLSVSCRKASASATKAAYSDSNVATNLLLATVHLLAVAQQGRNPGAPEADGWSRLKARRGPKNGKTGSGERVCA